MERHQRRRRVVRAQQSAYKSHLTHWRRFFWVPFLVLEYIEPVAGRLRRRQLLRLNRLCAYFLINLVFWLLGDITQGPSCSFFNTRVEFFETLVESFKRTRVHNCLGQGSGVLCDSSKNKGCGFLVKSLRYSYFYKGVTFCSAKLMTSWGRISLLTTASARSSE